MLSLVNAISFDIQSPSNFQDFILDATLSDGTVKHIEDTAYYAYTSTGKGRMHYLIPGVDVKNGPYVTAIKVSFPNNKNWGDNREKMEVWSNNNGNRLLPSVGLSLVEQDIPKKYPGTTIPVGSLSEKDSDSSYDKLTVKAKLHYENVLGENMTTDLTRFATEGASERIASQRVEVAFFQNLLSYASSNTYQGRELTVSGQLRFAPTAGTRNLAASKDLRVRPTYYLKIDKSFTYIDNSAKIQGFVPNATGAGMMWSAIGIPDVTFIPAGTGAGQSGHADYGILVISTDRIPENELPVPGQNLGAGWYGYINFLSFKLQADYSADPVYVKPVPGA